MSNEAMTLAWKAADAPVDPGPMWVLIILADHGSDHAGEDFKAFPSVERIMERSKFKRSTVEAHLKALVGLGWISRRRRSRPDGKKGVYDYELHRDEAYRTALRLARQAIDAAGQKPSGETKDLDHPCVKSTHGQPCSDFASAMLKKPDEPCSKSEHHEPPLNPQEEPSQRGREIAGLFEQVIAAAPAGILKFYDRDEAFEALWALDADGVDVADLPSALLRMAADPAFRSRKHPPQLNTWLSQRQFQGWPEAAAGTSAEVKASAPAAPANAASAADQATWGRALERLRGALPADQFGSYLQPAFLGQAEGPVEGEPGSGLFVVAFTATGRDWIRAQCWPRVRAAWADAGGEGALTLVSRHEFAALGRPTQGVG